MKTIVEFGNRGGKHSSFVCRTIKEGEELALKLSWVFGLTNACLKVSTKQPRSSVTSSTNFVSLSVLDGVERGVNAESWRKP